MSKADPYTVSRCYLCNAPTDNYGERQTHKPACPDHPNNKELAKRMFPGRQTEPKPETKKVLEVTGVERVDSNAYLSFNGHLLDEAEWSSAIHQDDARVHFHIRKWTSHQIDYDKWSAWLDNAYSHQLALIVPGTGDATIYEGPISLSSYSPWMIEFTFIGTEKK